MAIAMPKFDGIKLDLRDEKFAEEFSKTQELIPADVLRLSATVGSPPPKEQRIDNRSFGVQGNLNWPAGREHVEHEVGKAVASIRANLKKAAPWCAACDQAKIEVSIVDMPTFEGKKVAALARCRAPSGSCNQALCPPGTREAMHGNFAVKVDAFGRVAGLGLDSTINPHSVAASMGFAADKLTINGEMVRGDAFDGRRTAAQIDPDAPLTSALDAW